MSQSNSELYVKYVYPQAKVQHDYTTRPSARHRILSSNNAIESVVLSRWCKTIEGAWIDAEDKLDQSDLKMIEMK